MDQTDISRRNPPPDGHRVTIADENVEKISTTDTPDLVGITVKADTAQRAWDIARTYRQRGIPVVLGGIHPTVCPEDNAPHTDACVIGEAEELWTDLLRDAEAGCLKKICQSDQAPDLALTPIPRWELIDEKNYLYTNTLTMGRGCPWGCAFCYNSSPNLPKGHRAKPIANIIKEIESLGTRHVMFIDDNFIANPDFARELIRALLPLDLTWHTAVSADIGKHDDILDMMAQSGCRSLFIGLESLNPDNIQTANKQQNKTEEYEELIEKIHSRGMMVNASIVFGFDNDGPDVFRRTTQWLIDHKIESMTAHIMTPYPGTKLHTQLLAEGCIIDDNLTHYNTAHAVFRPARMTPAQLEAGYLGAYRHFYFWRSILARTPLDTRRAASTLGTIGLMRTLGKLGARLSYLGMNRKRTKASTQKTFTQVDLPE